MKNLPVTKRTAKDFAWTTWTPAQLRKAAKEALKTYKSEIQKVKDLKPEERTFESVCERLEVLDADLHNTQGPIEYIWYTHPKEAMRNAAQETANHLDNEVIDISSDPELLSVLDQALKNTDKKSLDTPARRLYESDIRGLKHAGFYLSKEDQTKLKNYRKNITRLVSDFDSTINNWDEGIEVPQDVMQDFPKLYLDQLEYNKKKGVYRVTLDYPQMIPFMRMCQNEKYRQELSVLSGKKGGRENIKRLIQIVELKTKVAQLLGYDLFSDLALSQKMAKTTKRVQGFIQKNLDKYYSKGQQDLDILRYAKERDGLKKQFANHDIAYYTNKVQEELYGLDSEKLKQYFTLDRVTEVMFEFFGKFFGVTYKEMKITFPHESVRTFEVTDTKTSEVVGYFSMDMHPRKGKYGHACMMNVLDSYEKNGKLQAPYATLIMNLALPTKDTPSLLEIREVETVFHEFGHVMHGVLGKAKYASQSGTRVARDFVEVPSQLFEEWVFEPQILKKLGKHYVTGKTIPQEMIDQVIASRKFMENFFMLRQFTLAHIDMEIYTNPQKASGMNKLYKDLSKKYLLPIPASSLQPASFSHITSGYAAGYYSYMWSLELAKKFYKYIKKEGVFSSRVGKRLRKEVLERGKTEDPNVLVKNFLRK